MTTKNIIHTDHAPKALGPYSQATTFGSLVFCSGQIALDPQTGEIVPDGVEDQTRQVLNNLQAVLEQAGSSLDKVLKTTVFIKDMNDFARVNAVYATYFTAQMPARSCVEVARLPKDVLVEIELIACI